MSTDNTNLTQKVESPSVAVEVVELQELTQEEVRLRLTLERKVERAFYESGKALSELRDRRLYRSSQVNQFSCTVVAWDGEYTVKMDHLKSMDYSDADCERMKVVGDSVSVSVAGRS